MTNSEKHQDDKECKRCGYVWQPRIKNPKCCPECKSRSWNKGKNNG